MKVVIPRRIKRREHSRSNKYYHYEYERSCKNIVIYRCKETGMIETFSKKEFIVNEEME